MKNKKGKTAAVLGMAMFLTMGTVFASATSISVEGGTWSYGVGNTVWSKYYHPKKIHGSSVINGNGFTDTDYNRKAGETSSASLQAVNGVTDHAYYCIGKR